MRLVLSSVLVAACLVVGCASEQADPGPEPITPPSSPADSADLSFYALATPGEALVQAIFAPLRPQRTSCQSEIVAGCTVSTCSGRPTGPSQGAAVDVGAVSAESATLGGHNDIALTAGLGRIVHQPSFPADELVHLKTTGSSVLPAIDETVRIPADVTELAIDGCVGSTSAKCPFTTAGATVSWTGGKGALVLVSIGSTYDTDTLTSVTCAYHGDDGRGHVPAAAVARLAGVPGLQLQLSARDDWARVRTGTGHAAWIVGIRWPTARMISLETPAP
jgi:hypothetical protein